MSLNPLNVSVQPPIPGEWGTAVDPATGRTYSYNAKTGETRWDDAPVKRISAIMLQEYTAAKVAPPICPPLHPEWKEIVDPKSGKTFYYHMTTGESQFAFVPAPVTFYSCFTDPCTRYLSFGLPGLGMFAESYIIFSVGNIKQWQQWSFPSCYNKLWPVQECGANQYLGFLDYGADGYVQLIGIIVGMLVMGVLGDIVGRKWGSRTAAAIMMSGVILLCFTPFAPSAFGYFGFFIASQTWFGVGVGTEYPMASGSAAELAEVHPELKAYRGRQVVLTFANQGVGNMFNCCIVLILYNSFNITGYSPPWLAAGDKSLAPVWHYDTSVTQVQSYCFGNSAGTGKNTATFTYCTVDENGYGMLKKGTTNECVVSSRTICASAPPNIGTLPVNPGSTRAPTSAPVQSFAPTPWPTVVPSFTPTQFPTFISTTNAVGQPGDGLGTFVYNAIPNGVPNQANLPLLKPIVPPTVAPTIAPTFGPTQPTVAPVTQGPTNAPTAIIPTPLLTEQNYVPPRANATFQLTCPSCSARIPNYPNGVPATRDQIPRYYPIDARTHWFSPKELMEGAFPDSKSVNVPYYPAGTWNPNGMGNGLPSIQNIPLFPSSSGKDCAGNTIPYVLGTGLVASPCTTTGSGTTATCTCTATTLTTTTAGVTPCRLDQQSSSSKFGTNCMWQGQGFKTFHYTTTTSVVGGTTTTTDYTNTQLPIQGGVSVSNFAYYPIWPAIPGAYTLPPASTSGASSYNPWPTPSISLSTGNIFTSGNVNALPGPYFALPNGAQPIDYLTAYYWDNTAQAYTWGAKQALSVMYGVGALLCFIMFFYRFVYLDESKMFDEERRRLEAVALEKGIVLGRGCGARCQAMAACDQQVDPDQQRRNTLAFCLYWPRQFSASWNWFINDFAFYGNKIQQSAFTKLLFTYPGASTPFITPLGLACWTALNSFVALTGYYVAAFLIDKPWYGRKNMQNVGFGAMFIIYIVIYGQYAYMNSTINLPYGMQWFQGLYYLSTWFQQFGPNCTTWLVAGENFPTAIRTTNHGIAAAWGKAGAIIASVWIFTLTDQPIGDPNGAFAFCPTVQTNNANNPTVCTPTTAATQYGFQYVFLISAIWSAFGVLCTWLFQPETTGLNLTELDVFHNIMMNDDPANYTGEAINPKHLSPWEKWVMGWHKNYVPPNNMRYALPCEGDEDCEGTQCDTAQGDVCCLDFCIGADCVYYRPKDEDPSKQLLIGGPGLPVDNLRIGIAPGQAHPINGTH